MNSRFADVEAELVTWLTEQMPGVDISTDTDTDLQDKLPAVRVYRIGGADTDYRLDHPVIDFDVFGADRETAHDTAMDLHELLRFTLAGNMTAGMVVGQVRTITTPRWLPYDNTTIRRFSATYQLTVHKR